MTKYHVYIGHDERLDEPYQICKASILKYASQEVTVHKLNHKDLRNKGLFSRPWIIKEDGSFEDLRDGRPFSNFFSHARFLTPYQARLDGADYAIFVDCDFVFRQDIIELFKEGIRNKDAFSVVKHDFFDTHDRKMDGQKQQNYNRKLWSSLMFFKVKDACFDILCPDYVNYMPGNFLHQFKWLGDKPIGGLDEKWNFIPEHSEKNVDTIAAIHYTKGVPSMEGYGNCPYNAVYWEYYNDIYGNDKSKLCHPRK